MAIPMALNLDGFAVTVSLRRFEELTRLAEGELADPHVSARALAALLGYDLHGEGFGLDVKDESGRLTLSPDMLKWDDTGITLTIDTRHPFSLTLDTLASGEWREIPIDSI